MSNTLLQTDLTKLLGVDALPEDEQASFIAEMGQVVLDTAITRLIASMTDEQQSALEHYLDSEPSAEDLMEKLINQYPNFGPILEDVVLEIKEDAVAVMPPVEEEKKG